MACLPTMTVLLVAIVAILAMEPLLTESVTPNLNSTRSSGNSRMHNRSRSYESPTKHVHLGGINKGRFYNWRTRPGTGHSRGATGGYVIRRNHTPPGLVRNRSRPGNNEKPHFGARRNRGGHESNDRDRKAGSGGRVSAGRNPRRFVNHGGPNRTRGPHQYIPKGGKGGGQTGGKAPGGGDKGGGQTGGKTPGGGDGGRNPGDNNQGSNNHGNNGQGSNDQGASNNQGNNGRGSNNLGGNNNQGNNGQGSNNEGGNNNQGSNGQGSNNQGHNSGQDDGRPSAGNATEPDCKKEGGVCGDPQVVGGDGRVYYFYGRRDRDFCLVSDPDLHINAHFIGTRPPHRDRDNTWVQSLAFFHARSTLTIAAERHFSHWIPEQNHLRFTYNNRPINLTTSWTSPDASSMSLTRYSPNSVEMTIKGKMKVTIVVLPVTRKANVVHKYEVPEDVDCFAHLDMQFTFSNLSPEVDGVLGQSYRRVNRSVAEADAFQSSSLLATDCASSRFTGGGVTPASSTSTTSGKLRAVCTSSGFPGHGLRCHE